MRVCIDSTIIVEIDRKKEVSIEMVKNLIRNGHEVQISVVTISEILSNPYKKDDHEKQVTEAKRILTQFSWINMDDKIAETAAKFIAYLLNEGQIIQFPDIIIAATAIEAQSDYLITLNKQHFERLPELKGKVFTPKEFTEKIKL